MKVESTYTCFKIGMLEFVLPMIEQYKAQVHSKVSVLENGNNGDG